MSLQQVVERFEALTGVQVTPSGRARFARLVATRCAERGAATVERYATDLDRPEGAVLAEQFVPRTTSFFRDDRGLQVLAHALRRQPSPSVWSAGCSSGEEAFSFVCRALEVGLGGVEVWGTDASGRAIARAKEARYASAPDELARRCADGQWLVTPEVRRRVRFEQHTLGGDQPAPIARFDAIVCRNVLMYLAPAARARALDTLHAALRPAGLMLLASTERLPSSSGFVVEIEAAASLYRRVDHIRR